MAGHILEQGLARPSPLYYSQTPGKHTLLQENAIFDAGPRSPAAISSALQGPLPPRGRMPSERRTRLPSPCPSAMAWCSNAKKCFDSLQRRCDNNRRTLIIAEMGLRFLQERVSGFCADRLGLSISRVVAELAIIRRFLTGGQARMLISRQGVGGGRAHTHCPWGECRPGSWTVISGSLTRGLFLSPGIRCRTTLSSPGASAEINREVAS